MTQVVELSAPEQFRAALADPKKAVTATRSVRIGLATFLVAAFSMAPHAIHRFVDAPSGLRGWPSAYTVLAAGVIGTILFVVDVIGPLRTNQRARTPFVTAAVAPAGLAAWGLLSVLWTDSPSRTPIEALALTLGLLTAGWLGWALTFREQAIALFFAVHLLALASTILAVTQESARFSDGSWMGVFTNPNLLGPMATFGILTAVAVRTFWVRPMPRSVIGACVAADVVAAAKATSATSWAALAGAIGALCLLGLSNFLAARGYSRRLMCALALAGGAALVPVAPFMFSRVARLLGKDDSLTHRTDIWDFVVDSVSARPIVGFGFGSFWDDVNSVATLSRRVGRIVGFAHSTFFETLLMLGVVGLVLVMLVVVLSVGASWARALGSGNDAMSWWAAVATFALLVNVTESMIAFHSIFWLLLVAPGFAAARHSVDGGAVRSRPSRPARLADGSGGLRR